MNKDININTNQKDYPNKLTPFKLAVLQNFPYIEADFDALTNYGLLCKIVEYLNNVIANQNVVQDNVSALNNAFTELKNYIDNYFKNLDIDDELNNKLDELAKNGTLNQLIGNYINPYLIQFNNSIDSQNETINQLNNKITNATNMNPLVANSISDMTDTSRIYVNVTDGKWYYYNTTTSTWTAGGIYQSSEDSQSVNILKHNMDLYNYGIIPYYNHINNSSYNIDHYYNNKNGTTEIKTAKNYATFDPFYVKGGYTYTCYNSNGLEYGIIAKAFTFLCDINGNIIESNMFQENIHKIKPTKDGYLYLTVTETNKADYTNCMICTENTQPSSYKGYNEPYEYLFLNEKMSDIINYYKNASVQPIIKYNTINVGPNRLYTKIANAIKSIKDSSQYNIYNIIIDDGTYLENNLNLPNFVNLIGESGIPENCIIDGSLPANVSDSNMSGTSTINMNYNNELHNISVIAKNMRYPIHSESNGNFKNFIQIIDNCYIEHLGNQEVIDFRKEHDIDPGNPWNSPHGFGMGASSGCKLIITNSTLKSVEDAFYVHGASDFIKPYLITIQNTKLISTKLINSVYVDNNTPKINGNSIIIKDCFLNSRYAIIENTAYSYHAIISGSNVVPVYQRPNHVNNINGYPTFTNNTKIMIADENLSTGTFVTSKDGIHVKHATSNTPLNEIIGFTLGNVSANDDVIINSKYMQPSNQNWPETSIVSGINLYLDDNGKITTNIGNVKIGVTEDRWYKLYI